MVTYMLGYHLSRPKGQLCTLKSFEFHFSCICRRHLSNSIKRFFQYLKNVEDLSKVNRINTFGDLLPKWSRKFFLPVHYIFLRLGLFFEYSLQNVMETGPTSLQGWFTPIRVQPKLHQTYDQYCDIFQKRTSGYKMLLFGVYFACVI